MSGPFKWVPMSVSQLSHYFPLGALAGGTDIDGASIYVGRASHAGDLIPAKVIPSKSACYVSHGGLEIAKENFELLVPLTVSWKPARHGMVPPGAVEAGHTTDGETLYIGRVLHDGCITPGKIHPSHGKCYYPFGQEEHSAEEYDCLVVE